MSDSDSDSDARESSLASKLAIHELDDASWNDVAALLPEPSALGRRRSTDPRRVVSAIHYQWRTGCPWRKLPPEFQPWPTIYGYVAAWRRDGTLRKLRPLLDPKQRHLRRCEESLPDRLNPLREPIDRGWRGLSPEGRGPERDADTSGPTGIRP